MNDTAKTGLSIGIGISIQQKGSYGYCWTIEKKACKKTQ